MSRLEENLEIIKKLKENSPKFNNLQVFGTTLIYNNQFFNLEEIDLVRELSIVLPKSVINNLINDSNIDYIMDYINMNKDNFYKYIKSEDLKYIKEKIEKYKKATNLNNIFNQGSTQIPGVTDTTRWSPQSSAGIVYEWNRGVIAISTDGTVIKENLDGTRNHHADATVRVANQLGISLTNINHPYLAGCEASANDLVLFQSEGNKAFFYLPESITEEQASAIEEIAKPRSSFSFSIAYMEVPFDDLTYDKLMNFVLEKTQKLDMAI